MPLMVEARRSRRHYLLAASICVAVLCALCGCHHPKETEKRPEPKAVMYLLLDLTRPPKSKVRKDYPKQVLDYAKAAVQADVPKPCAFIVSFIRWRSAGGSELYMDETFYQSLPSSLNTDEPKYAEEVSALGRIAQKCKQMPGGEPPPQGTEIFEALDVVSKNMGRFPKAEKHLYIFSDMMEQSEHLPDFCDNGMDPETMDKLASDPRLLPYFNQVQGVRVFVYGADGVSSVRTRNVRKFWLTAFKKAGWQLSEADYNTTVGLRPFQGQ